MHNKSLVVLNLQEVVETLKEIIDETIESGNYPEERLVKSMERAYQHLNYAWHIHKERDEVVDMASNENLAKWSKLPVGEIDEYH